MCFRTEARDVETSPYIESRMPNKMTDISESALQAVQDDLRQHIEHHKTLLK
jgi:hypothetical protein